MAVINDTAGGNYVQEKKFFHVRLLYSNNDNVDVVREQAIGIAGNGGRTNDNKKRRIGDKTCMDRKDIE
jgi:hypothetical protein